ncbi:S1 RNA-binding domain-containing protein [Nocardiopsis lucentensis]|uniref:S1 RNA-binding domain-containing protein n=1 Tax=Nocardiopsis lucentensis TaxID=53441 RepID=UPI00034804BD|nr:S1 RNA-binding domain-containing protein [Nocardiopsis lucentensis]
MPLHVHRVTKYDPAARDANGHYVGSENVDSDYGPIEAAYLDAIAAFARDSGVDHLEVREPLFGGASTPAAIARLFPSAPVGFHDGTTVPLSVGLELVRTMLRGDEAFWCQLEVEDTFAVHVSGDLYVYVGSREPCHEAVARTRGLGLFPEPMDVSPDDVFFDSGDEPGEQRPADATFWARLDHLGHGRGVLLEEEFVGNATRWHRVTRETAADVRARLAPRARLTVWPPLADDVDGVLAALPEEDPVELVWEDAHGRLRSEEFDGPDHRALAALLSGARGAMVLSDHVGQRRPLLTAVLPDPDGVLRARWRTEPADSDRAWAFMRTLERGRLVTGTVARIADFGGTFVDLGGCTAMINLPELSSRPFDAPTDVVSVGQEVTARILDVDMVRERVSLTLRLP